MATYTTNLNLKKPAQSDKIRIADINNNMDDIDAAFGAVGNDSVATQIGNLQGALAIVAVGDSHAAVTAGQFVYVRSHETLDAGLYVASSNIAENGALSLSNLTADSSGGLNALNSNKAQKMPVPITDATEVFRNDHGGNKIHTLASEGWYRITVRAGSGSSVILSTHPTASSMAGTVAFVSAQAGTMTDFVTFLPAGLRFICDCSNSNDLVSIKLFS